MSDILWDYDFLYDEYKSIRSSLQGDGYLLPYYLTVVEIPIEYDYSFNEWNNILDNTSSKHKENLISMSKNRRRIEIQILKGEHEEYDTLDEYHLYELNEFFKKYPRYKNIIKGGQ